MARFDFDNMVKELEVQLNEAKKKDPLKRQHSKAMQSSDDELPDDKAVFENQT